MEKLSSNVSFNAFLTAYLEGLTLEEIRASRYDYAHDAGKWGAVIKSCGGVIPVNHGGSWLLENGKEKDGTPLIKSMECKAMWFDLQGEGEEFRAANKDYAWVIVGGQS